jgi:hypothetical protein
LWSRLRDLTIGVSALVSFILFLTPITTWLPASLLFGVAILLLHIFSQHLRIRDLTETIRAQGDIAEEHLEGLKARYDSSLVIAEIGNATATLMNPEALREKVVNVMRNRLSYERGILQFDFL